MVPPGRDYFPSAFLQPNPTVNFAEIPATTDAHRRFAQSLNAQAARTRDWLGAYASFYYAGVGCGTLDRLRVLVHSAIARRRMMRISARNVLEGKVHSVTLGAVNAEVTLALEGGEQIVSVITNNSVESLGLETGEPAFAIIKANEVIVGRGVEGSKLSARNVLAGEVTNVLDGAVNSEVAIRLAGGTEVVASITKGSVERLELQPGDRVSAIVKASNVLIGL
jgi:molybdate transport system regulatory protein